MNNPEFYNKIKDKISADIFATDFNKRVFEIISQRLENSESIDLSLLSSFFTPEETGRLAKFITKRYETSNTAEECFDCIKVLREEHDKKNKPDPVKMSDEEFLNHFRKKSEV